MDKKLNLECVQKGFANGVAPDFPLKDKQKELSIQYDIEVDITDKTVFIIDDILDTGGTMKVLIKHFKQLGAKQVETVSAVYKENLDFPNHFYIYKQKENENPWYIGYGMDGPKGYSRNLDTIHTL